MVDTGDSKSSAPLGHESSNLSLGTRDKKGLERAIDDADEALRLLRKKKAAGAGPSPNLDRAIARLVNIRTLIAALIQAEGNSAKIRTAEDEFLRNRPPPPKKRSIWSRFRRDSR